MAKIKATHRLRRPHQVAFDPRCHFVKKADAPRVGDRVILPIGTHVIPSEAQLANLPDRFESLSTPEPPAEMEVDDEDDEDAAVDEDDDEDEGNPDEDEPEGSEDEGSEDEPEASDSFSAADAAVNDALEAVGKDWSALTLSQLRELAGAYELDVKGTGSDGNLLKADWLQAVQGARRAA